MTVLKRLSTAAVLASMLGSSALLAAPAYAAKSLGSTAGSSSSVVPHTAIANIYTCSASTVLATEESCFNGMMYALARFDGHAAADTAILDVAVEPTLINYYSSLYPSYVSYLNADPYSTWLVMETAIEQSVMSLSNNGVFSSTVASELENSSSTLFKTDILGTVGNTMTAENYIKATLIQNTDSSLPVPLSGATNFEGTFILGYFIIDHQTNTWLGQFGLDAIQEWSSAVLEANEAALADAEAVY
jgi:hypothetical protein